MIVGKVEIAHTFQNSRITESNFYRMPKKVFPVSKKNYFGESLLYFLNKKSELVFSNFLVKLVFFPNTYVLITVICLAVFC